MKVVLLGLLSTYHSRGLQILTLFSEEEIGSPAEVVAMVAAGHAAETARLTIGAGLGRDPATVRRTFALLAAKGIDVVALTVDEDEGAMAMQVVGVDVAARLDEVGCVFLVFFF